VPVPAIRKNGKDQNYMMNAREEQLGPMIDAGKAPIESLRTEIGRDTAKAAAWLQAGELVGMPTETVYGLAANACMESAVRRVFAVKNRPLHNPLIVHTDEVEKIRPFVTEIPDAALALLRHFAPGPLTVLLPASRRLPSVVNNGKRELAFRIPAHPLALGLLGLLDFPLVAPSANVFTSISPTEPRHVLKNFDGRIPYILDGGASQVGIESTVVGFDPEGAPLIYREGAITAEQIALVTGTVRYNGHKEAQLSPGMHLHHYAPKTPLLLTPAFRPLPQYATERTGILCFSGTYPEVPLRNQFVLSAEGNLEEAARNLYRGLHYLDELGLDVLVAETCPPVGLGKAINDRLGRAAYIFNKV